MSPVILKVEALTKHFGGIHAVDDVTFDVQRGSITSLIGPNGAGKTTVFNVATGLYEKTSGAIRFEPDGAGSVDVTERVFDPLHATLVSVSGAITTLRVVEGNAAISAPVALDLCRK